MARPKRMGAYNALDDLLPGPAWGPFEDQGPAWDLADPAEPAGAPAAPPRRPRLKPVPDPSPPPRPRQARPGANALDELLPGPSVTAGRPVGAAPRGRGAGRHLGVWNPLDGPPPAQPTPARGLPREPAPAPGPAPARVRVSFRLPADLVETARDAVAHLAGTAEAATLTALAERALRVELARLAITHNHGQPFPPREP
jgi:hypothetical protein